MIWVQVISIVFSLITVIFSAPIVSRFEFSGGADIIRKMTLLHRQTFLCKVVFCIGQTGAVYYATHSYLSAAISSLLAALWIYLTFDVLLNRFRHPKRPWDYLGLNDGDGRFWNGLFGRQAGKIKAIVLLLAIISINVFIWKQKWM